MKKILFALILSVIVGSTTTNYTYAATTINSTVTIQDSQDEPMMESSEASAGFTQELKKRLLFLQQSLFVLHHLLVQPNHRFL